MEKELLVITHNGDNQHEGEMSWEEAAQWILDRAGISREADNMVSASDHLAYLQQENRNRPLESWDIVREDDYTPFNDEPDGLSNYGSDLLHHQREAQKLK